MQKDASPTGSLSLAHLLRDNKRLAATLDGVGDGLIIVDRDARVVLLNEVAQRLTGYTNVRARGELFGDVLVVIDESGQSSCPLMRVLEERAAAGASRCGQIKSCDGQIFHIEASATPLCDEDDHIIGAAMVFRDVSEREAVRRDLQHSNDRHQSLIQAMSQIIWTTPPDGYVEDMMLWREYTGQTLEEIRGWGWLNAIHPDDRDMVRNIWNECAQTRTPYKVEYRIRRHDAVYRSFLVRGVPVLESDGSVREWVGTCTDIHERKQAELLLNGQRRVLEMIARGETLAATLNTLAQLIESHSGALCSVHIAEPGPYLRFVAAPSLPLAYLKHAQHVPIGPRMASCGTAAFFRQTVIVEDIATDPLWADYKHLALQHGLRACWSMPVLNGNELLGTFAMYASRIRTPSDEELELLRVATNLAGIAIEREHSERSLLSSLAREARSTTELSSILSRIADGVLTVDTEGTITFENEAARKIHGRSLLNYNLRQEDMRPPLRDLDGNMVSSKNSPLARAVFRGEEVNETELIVTRPDGSEVSVEVNAVPVHSSDGVQLGAVLTLRDVTTQRQLIRDMLEASRSKDEFLAILSHELRTPLTPILGWTSLLRQIDRDDDATFQQAVDSIERNAKLQKRLVNDLLDTTRIVSDKLQIEKRAANLNELVRLAVRSVQEQANENDVRIEYSTDENLPLMYFDIERIQQVLMNLLSNAIKFSHKDSKISLSTQLHKKKFGENLGTRYALVEVSDQGQGISPELLPHVFDLFRQGDSSFTRRHGGLGLGLAICKSLVEMHGGTIQAYSDGTNRGSIFRVLLPIESMAQQYENDLSLESFCL